MQTYDTGKRLLFQHFGDGLSTQSAAPSVQHRSMQYQWCMQDDEVDPRDWTFVYWLEVDYLLVARLAVSFSLHTIMPLTFVYWLEVDYFMVARLAVSSSLHAFMPLAVRYRLSSRICISYLQLVY